MGAGADKRLYPYLESYLVRSDQSALIPILGEKRSDEMGLFSRPQDVAFIAAQSVMFLVDLNGRD